MKARYFLVGLVALTVGLGYAGTRYQARRRVELTAQLEAAIDASQNARAVHLLQMGADANAIAHSVESETFIGEPLIFKAVRFGDSAVIKAFIAAGADVNMARIENGKSVTLLSVVSPYVSGSNGAQKMKTLLEAGANPNLGSESLLSSSAVGCGSHGDCWCNPRPLKLLLSYGAKLRKGDASKMMETAGYALHGSMFSGYDIDTPGRRDSLQMMRLCVILPLPVYERLALIHRAIESVSSNRYEDYSGPGTLKKARMETLAFLRRELQKMQTGSQHR